MQNFEVSLTPATGFLPMHVTFMTDIPGNYFVHNNVALFDRSELEFSDFDKKNYF